ncbi:molybdenum cofactor guanylyltransferase [Aurantiacibacter rhizosphaerae]|uniref:NTP transferase domain-containing protein n=1 Tax=Aurantiacibacter rhizosphaerae TaxID=2691582 RepID=A0A844XEH0_9SPHN|nr:molybdenum cofactor guanylyltransferase [Aurantiacibacter rhizosphaerae]MWV28877.1 NTP transferase domain-containing protein [Aurantiacibacter rhizosphaerae]
MILGAVLAGGKSSRFGTDKALAELDGRTLIARAVETLSGFCDDVIVVGRETAPAPTVPDWPRSDMGPLGGIAGALRHAEAEGYDSVLTCGVDSVALPATLLSDLSPAPAYLETQPVIGHWKSNNASVVSAILQSEGRHSMLAFAKAARARAVKSDDAPANINTPADLAAMER